MPQNVLLHAGYLRNILLALLPILIFYLFAQKQIIGGVVNGAVK